MTFKLFRQSIESTLSGAILKLDKYLYKKQGEYNEKALIVIDVQNDYFPNGSFSLWNTETVLTNIERAIQTATEKNIPVIHVQHVADKSRGMSPFFNEGTEGVQVHSRIMASAPNSPVVVKHAADSFMKQI